MLSYEEALEIVEHQVRPLKVRSIPLSGCLNLTLARDIRAKLDMPQFTNSAMDGVGVRLADTSCANRESPAILKLDSLSRAGSRKPGRLKSGHAVRIFTGAPVPSGVDAVVMQEKCSFQDNTVSIAGPPKPGENIRIRGEEYKRGIVLLDKGTRITPPIISVLASQGYAYVPVRPGPRIAIVSSGDELVQPGADLEHGQIYDSNSAGLSAACQTLNLNPDLHRIPDKAAVVTRKFAKLLNEFDVLIVAGGVSVGDYDLNRQVFDNLKVKKQYHMLAIKPGKPNYFGVYQRSADAMEGSGRTYVFGLPGNPVAVLVSFLKLVKPGLCRLMGSEIEATRVKVTLLKEIRKKKGRLEWVRASLVERDQQPLAAMPLTSQGSNMMSGLAGADCLITFPAELELLKKGSEVEAEQITW